jgi:hypothetical protein
VGHSHTAGTADTSCLASATDPELYSNRLDHSSCKADDLTCASTVLLYLDLSSSNRSNLSLELHSTSSQHHHFTQIPQPPSTQRCPNLYHFVITYFSFPYNNGSQTACMGTCKPSQISPSDLTLFDDADTSSPKQQPRDDVYGAYDASYMQSNGPNQHTQSPIVTGTSVVAIKFKDGVVMAADNLGMLRSSSPLNQSIYIYIRL